jgi:hypothetical protein
VALLPGWITGIATPGLIWVSAEFAGVRWLSPQVTRPNWFAIVAWYLGLVWVSAWLGRRGDGCHRASHEGGVDEGRSESERRGAAN